MILLDQIMPGMSGEDTLNEMKEMDILKDTPVMLIWGDDPDSLKIKKDRLDGIYKCVCVTGKAAMEKYLSKHEPDGVMHVVTKDTV